MNIEEAKHLADWVSRHVAKAAQLYEPLVKKTGQAAAPRSRNNQPSPVPQIKNDADILKAYLSKMPINQLNRQQWDTLVRHNATKYIASAGVEFVNSVLLDANYDPQTASNEFQAARDTLLQTVSTFASLSEAVLNSQLISDDVSDGDYETIIRVQFERDASINNTVDLKSWTSELESVFRAASVWVDERPEDVKVVSASRGSIIFDLGTSVVIAKIITYFAKEVLSIAKSSLEVAHMVEELKQKKMHTNAVEQEIGKAVESRKKTLPDDIVEGVKEVTGRPGEPEKDEALKKAVGNFKKFIEKGGGVDIVEKRIPYESEDEDAEEAARETGEWEELRESAEEMRHIRQELRYIEDKRNVEDDDAEKNDPEGSE